MLQYFASHSYRQLQLTSTKLNNSSKHTKLNNYRHNKRLYKQKCILLAGLSTDDLIFSCFLSIGCAQGSLTHYSCHPVIVLTVSAATSGYIQVGLTGVVSSLSTFTQLLTVVRPGRPFLPPEWRRGVCLRRMQGHGCSSSRTRRRSLSQSA